MVPEPDAMVHAGFAIFHCCASWHLSHVFTYITMRKIECSDYIANIKIPFRLGKLTNEQCHYKAQASKIWRRFHTVFVSAQMCLTVNAVSIVLLLSSAFSATKWGLPFPLLSPHWLSIVSVVKEIFCASLARAYRLLHARTAVVDDVVIKFLNSYFILASSSSAFRSFPTSFAILTTTDTWFLILLL